MAYIESHQTLGNHPKTKRAARLLGVGRVQVVGHLHYLWWWALEYAEDGDLSRFSDAEIAEEAMWEGDPAAFVAALVEVGFVDVTRYVTQEGGGGPVTSRRLHDWDHYTGRLVAQRESNRERQRRFRERQKDQEKPEAAPNPPSEPVTVTSPLRNAATVPNRTVPNRTKPDRGNAPPTPPPAAPEPPKAHPYALLEAVCDELGQDATALSKPAKERQLAAAKRIAGAGMGEADVRAMVRWLAPQSWVNGAVDMGLLEKQLPKWEMAGRPNGPPPASGPGGRATHNGKDIGYSNEEIERRLGMRE